VSRSSHEDIGSVYTALEGLDVVTLHTSLKCSDWVNLSDNDTCTA
jgi:hypothetical protein